LDNARESEDHMTSHYAGIMNIVS